MEVRRRALVTDATSYKAAVVVRHLRRYHPDVRVATADARPLSRWLHTRHSHRHLVLRHGAEAGAAYVAELRDLVDRERIDVLLPVHSTEMDLLLRDREAFGGALDYWGSLEAFRHLDDKGQLYRLARAAGIRCPEVFPTLEALRLPAVAKPARSSSARGVRYLRTAGDVAAYRAAPGEGDILQEYVAGAGVGYSVFAQGGAILAGYGHRRLAEYPVTGGSSVYREGFDDDEMVDVARRVLGVTSWSGFAMFEFKLTPAGERVLLEVNPRIWGSIHQALQGGAPLLEPLFGAAVGLTPRTHRTYFSPAVYLALARYLARGETRPAMTFLSRPWRNRADIHLTDPGAWLGSFLRLG